MTRTSESLAQFTTLFSSIRSRQNGDLRFSLQNATRVHRKPMIFTAILTARFIEKATAVRQAIAGHFMNGTVTNSIGDFRQKSATS